MANIKLAESSLKTIKDICASFNYNPGDLINVLHKVQSALGYLSAETQEAVAKELKISTASVYGVVSFYSFFTMKPKGEHPIAICMGTACYVRGAEKVVEEFKKQLGVAIGETTEDGKFSLTCLRCVGACGLAPVVTVGEKVYGSVTPAGVEEILNNYA
jgi:NADH-quinone oxidoreductase subunit E/NADP-reducing hydrogenase subunit HndA